MIRVMSAREIAIEFLRKLGAQALINGRIHDDYSTYAGGPEVYERALLDVLQDMCSLPNSKNECGLVDCHCPSHYSANSREESRRIHTQKVENRDRKRISHDEIASIVDELEKELKNDKKPPLIKSDKKER